SQVYVEGEIRYDKYTGQDGVEKFFTEIVANEMQMLGGRGEGGGGGGGQRGGGDFQRGPRESGQGQQGQGQGQGRQAPAAAPAAAAFDDGGFSDDDIPF